MLLKNISTYLKNDSYNINISKNELYINNYTNIDNISEKNITLLIENFKLIINGQDFKVLKMQNNEILFNGSIESITYKYI